MQFDFWPHVGSPVDNIIDGPQENICTLNRLLTDDEKKARRTHKDEVDQTQNTNKINQT